MAKEKEKRLIVRNIAQIQYVICAYLVIRPADSMAPSKPIQKPTYDMLYYIKQSTETYILAYILLQ